MSEPKYGEVSAVEQEREEFRRGERRRSVLTSIGSSLAFIALVYPLIKGKPAKKRLALIPVVFLLCMLIATAIELGTSYLLEALTGSWPWQTYADYAINFEARIALSPSVRFGLGGVFFLYILQPLFEKLTKRLGDKGTARVAAVFLVVLACDCVYTFFFR